MKLLDLFENQASIKTQVTYVDYHHGQHDAYVYAYVDGVCRGQLKFSVYEGIAQIQWIEVSDEFKRQGIASAMLQALEQDVGRENIEWSNTTHDGTALRAYWEHNLNEDQMSIVVRTENFTSGQEKKFIVHLLQHNNEVGNFVFSTHADHYNPQRVRVNNFAYIEPKDRSQGLGKLLLLAAIVTAEKYRIPFEKDDSVIAPAQRAVYSWLENNGYITRSNPVEDAAGFDHVYWSITDTGTEYLNSRVTWTSAVNENFADGKGPGRPGDSARAGIPKHATLAQLDRIGRGRGRKAQLARWQANMRRGHKK